MRSFAFLIPILALCACAREAAPRLKVTDGWARPAAAGSQSAAYFTIANRGGADALTGVRSTIGRASLHVSTIEDGIARMRPVDPAVGLTVPSNGKLSLSPGGAHVMLSGLSRPLKDNDRFVLVLTFRTSRAKRATVTVGPPPMGPVDL